MSLVTGSRTETHGRNTLTMDGVTLNITSGRVVLDGRDIYHSEGAEFSVVFQSAPWWQPFRRRLRVTVLP